MPEVPDSLTPKDDGGNDSPELIRWRSISYSTVFLWAGILVVVALGVLTFLYPGWWYSVIAMFTGAPKATHSGPAVTVHLARFTNLDGTVRVRKANQVQWSSATVSMEIEEGDTVQTLRDGIARIAFPDGALYVVKPDTLIVIEESASQNNRTSSNVAVNVTSGAVDLSTARTSGDSRILFANAEARVHSESRAVVSNNPQTNQHQITVSKGGARLQRGGEQVELAQYEQASFAGPETSIVKAKVVAPPILLSPSNAAPIVLGSSPTTEVDFTWSAVPGADSYRLRIASTPMFSNLLVDRRLQSTSVRLPTFKAGDYFWSVTTIGAEQKESPPSDANQFSVLKEGNQGELLLLVDKFIQHGKVIEIVGRTEPGATVLVNNEPVFNVAPNGSFKHFTAPLSNTGPSQITITAQNSKGKVATLRKTLNIQ